MAEIDRPTVTATAMTNAHTNPPSSGSKVWALNHGGCVVPLVWTTRSIELYDAWYPYLKVPQDVKDIQAERYRAGRKHQTLCSLSARA